MNLNFVGFCSAKEVSVESVLPHFSLLILFSMVPHLSSDPCPIPWPVQGAGWAGGVSLVLASHIGRQLQPYFFCLATCGPKRTGAFGPEHGGTKGTEVKRMRLDCHHTPMCYKKEWVCLHLLCVFSLVIFMLLSDISCKS